MRTVVIGELKNKLKGFLQYVKTRQELVMRDRRVPTAEILPLPQWSKVDQEADLFATGVLKMPEQQLDWDLFFLAPAGDISRKTATQAAIDCRGDR